MTASSLLARQSGSSVTGIASKPIEAKRMIFASVGSMLPFERFTRAVDAWSAANPTTDVLIQIGDGDYEPRHARWVRMMPHKAYSEALAACDLFVAHVGIGSILQALERGKQMLMLARRASLGEHTTEHQLHTVARFSHTPGLEFAENVVSLQFKMTELLRQPSIAGPVIAPYAPPEMCDRIGAFLDTAATN